MREHYTPAKAQTRAEAFAGVLLAAAIGTALGLLLAYNI